MFCAACTEPTEAVPCARCGQDPRVAGRYALLEVLGRGSGGTTWRALGPDGPVAIKETVRGRGDVQKAAELAEREADVLRQLRHPQIPRFVERLETEAARTHHLWLVQELIPGTNLQAELETRRWSEAEVLGLIADLCTPLGYLHSRSPPIIHRDLKPGNVLRGADGRFRLVDFGSVRDSAPGAYGGSTVAGTFGYMAPEQFAGDADPRSDLYALGALAVALLVREDPAKLQGNDRRVVWRDRTEVSSGTAALIDDLLALDSAARPASAAEVAERATELLAAPPRGRSRPPAPDRLRAAHAPVKVAQAEVAPAGPRPVRDRPRPSPEDFHSPPAVVHTIARSRTRLLTGTLAGAFMMLAVTLGFVMLSLAMWIQLSPTRVPVAPRQAVNVVAGNVWPVLDAGEAAGLRPVDCAVTPEGVTGCDARFAGIAAQMALKDPSIDHVVWQLGMVRGSDLEKAASTIQVRPGEVTATVVDPALQPTTRTPPANPFPPVSAGVAETTCQIEAVVGIDGLVYSATVSNCPLPYHASVKSELEGTTFPKPATPQLAHLERGFAWAVNGLIR